MVPLFMIGKLGNEIDTKFKAAHDNIFATLLDLMNYPEALRNRAYAISLMKAKESDSRERYFVSPESKNKVKFD